MDEQERESLVAPNRNNVVAVIDNEPSSSLYNMLFGMCFGVADDE